MTQVLVIVLALLIGVIAGLRAMTAPAVVAWGAFLGWIDVDGKWSEWVAHPITVTVLTIFLLVELVTDQLPKTPSRKTAPQFATRLIMGAFAGAVIGSAFFHTFSSIGAGIVGAVLGTMGGAAVRTKLLRQQRSGPAGRDSGGRGGGGRRIPDRLPGQPRLNRLWQINSTRSSSAPARPGRRWQAG